MIRRIGGVRDIQVEVRVIAASNRDLEREVREGRFRQDLYYRLAIICHLLARPCANARRTSAPGRVFPGALQPQIPQVRAGH